MAKNPKNSRVSQNTSRTADDFSFERSIGQLTNVIQNLTTKLDQKPTTPQKPEKPPKPPKPQKPTVEGPDMSDFENALGDVGQKVFNGIDSIFGRRSSKKLKEKIFNGIAGKNNPLAGAGKQLLEGGVDAAGGGMASAAGGALKALGAVTAVIDATKKLFDFINSGEAAQAAADFGAIFNVDTTKLTESLFKASKKYRDIIANFNIMVPLQMAQEARRDALEYAKSLETDLVTFQQSKVKDLYDYEMGLMRDNITFANDQAAQSLDANMARNKTLFTSGMAYMRGAIGVSERALQAIGSSTQAILDTVKEVGIGLGTSLRNQIAMATSAQGLAVKYGGSADDVLKMSKTFRLMNKFSAEQAMNLTAGLASYAKINDMEPAQLFKEMADSQQEIFKYTNYTGQEYAKQVVMLKNMNTSMTSMMKASDTMVLNYKDSMKAEMSLGAMIGQNVDLSQTRAALMSGDMGGAASSLKTALSGIDIAAMNPFAKQQLSEATGMGIDEIMNIMSGKEAKSKGQLQQEEYKKAGASIANGALQQDIANAGAKLALEQKQRAKLLEFEQMVRKNSLMIEQAQRMQNLAIEQKYRLKFAKLTTDAEIETELAKMQAEAASNFFTNISKGAGGIQQNEIQARGMKAEDLAKFIGKEQTNMNTLASAGVIKADDYNLAKYAAQYSRFEMSKDIKDFPKAADYFGKQLNDAMTKINNTKPKTQEEKQASLPYVKKKAAPTIKLAEEEGGFWNWAARQVAAADASQGTSMEAAMEIQKHDKKVQAAVAAAPGLKEQITAMEEQKKRLETANKLMLDESTKINSLKEQSAKSGNLTYKQNELMLKYTGQTNDFMKALVESGQTPITLDGKILNKGLLNVNQKQYGLGAAK